MSSSIPSSNGKWYIWNWAWDYLEAQIICTCRWLPFWVCYFCHTVISPLTSLKPSWGTPYYLNIWLWLTDLSIWLVGTEWKWTATSLQPHSGLALKDRSGFEALLAYFLIRSTALGELPNFSKPQFPYLLWGLSEIIPAKVSTWHMISAQ